MPQYCCPRCQQQTIPLKEKYKTSYWFLTQCANCSSTISANPIILAIVDVVYVWVAVTFCSMVYFQQSLIPILYLIVVWLILDFLNVHYMALSIVKSGPPRSKEPADS
ncbi:MAG: hypothetical protein GXP10_07515 [Gammaproteobacteria bacterium]|nr:hypothetical protein [Gammaproteobacteria bacterium]